MTSPFPGGGSDGLQLTLAEESAAIVIAWQCRESSCGDNGEGYLLFSRATGGEPVLLYAPALYELIRSLPVTKAP